ncbi:hypothetical protein IQ13_2678 [Lacibacter cauensis]|uniref:Kelch motif protein n=1 Tax=Lacibacter cauensis TaxID=510947 RepID=A0A562SLY1_9BACT|nr:hypothetical protein [Lacibacter cauensis]TWI81660.1 hypothetical protein IQ13_2678 [Lacibacter cauensis]
MLKLQAIISFLLLSGCLFSACSKDPSPDDAANGNSPQIIRFMPTTVQSGDTLRIELKNFSQTYTSDTSASRKDIVLIGTVPATVLSANQTTLSVSINALHRSNKLIVVIGKDTAISKDAVIIGSGSWQKISTCPSGNRTNPSVFIFGDSAYYGFGMGFRNGYVTGLPDFWKLNLKDGSWVKLFDVAVSDPLYSECVSFQVNGKAYISFRSAANQTWNYTAATRTWARNSSVYNGSYFLQSTGSSSNYALIGASDNPAANGKSGFYQYDATNNSFSYLADITDTAKSPIITGCMVGSDFYFGIRQELVNGAYNQTRKFYKFNTATKTYTRLSDLPELFATWSASFGFSYNGSGYILNDHRLFKYDAVTNSWQRKQDFTGFPALSVNYYGSFEYNSALYVFAYNDSQQVTELWKYSE